MEYIGELTNNPQTTKPIVDWLQNNTFKSGYLENCFAEEIVIYETSLEYYDSIIEAFIHGSHKALNFKPSKLTNVIFKLCNKMHIETNGYWFNVNCHDNDKGVIERIGKYQFDSKHGLCNEIFILYDMLDPNCFDPYKTRVIF